ncbi:MAG: acetyl-CoA hydrolase/transferase C-terminal domain-containing protein [Bacillota bacterium]|nr:acetyl-CoA hydrolase/transferase C-terminal domain-containing protein [Bacillota bacterium]
MNSYTELYNKKKCSVDEALSHIQPGSRIIVGQAAAEPAALMEKLHTLVDRGVGNLEVQTSLVLGHYEFIENPKYSGDISNHCWFLTDVTRRAQQEGRLTFTPQHAHRAVPKKLSHPVERPLVLLVTCSPMDKHGYVSLSVSNIYEHDFYKAGAKVICEINPHYPRTFGDNLIHIRDIEAFVETNRPVPEIELSDFSEADELIGEHIAQLVEDGSTIQLGIGKIPNAVARQLRSKKHLGIHTEMFTENMMDLIECGAVDNSRKGLYNGYSVCAFAYGSKRVYDYLDDNPSVLILPGSFVNDPYQIAKTNRYVSINTALEVELTGQCASESLAHLQYSGTGGQADTVIGSQRSKGGKSFIALHSTRITRQPDGGTTTASKIVSQLSPGSIVSLSRNDVDYVVTEHGVAWLKGLSMRERVVALVRIAHPDFREQLTDEAKKRKFI